MPIRDMRLVDPNLLTSETGKVLVRDNAIVFSVEHVRIIITGDQVCLFDPATVHELVTLYTPQPPWLGLAGWAVQREGPAYYPLWLCLAVYTPHSDGPTMNLALTRQQRGSC